MKYFWQEELLDIFTERIAIVFVVIKWTYRRTSVNSHHTY